MEVFAILCFAMTAGAIDIPFDQLKSKFLSFNEWISVREIQGKKVKCMDIE